MLANVTPVVESGKIVGYMSVRSKPSRELILKTDTAYKKFKNGSAQGLAIRDGEVVQTGLLSKLAGLQNMSLSIRLMLGFGLPAVLLTGMAIAGLASGQNQWLVSINAISVVAVLYSWYALHSAILTPLRLTTRVARAVTCRQNLPLPATTTPDSYCGLCSK